MSAELQPAKPSLHTREGIIQALDDQLSEFKRQLQEVQKQIEAHEIAIAALQGKPIVPATPMWGGSVSGMANQARSR